MVTDEPYDDAAGLLEFWFSEEVSRRWFRSTPQFDEALRRRYEPLVVAALQGELRKWAATPRGALALVLLLDQLPLNIYRGQARGFVGEQQAREVAAAALEQGWDRQLSEKEKAFLYIPFMHSENLADQQRAVALYRAAGLEGNLRWAEHHCDIIRRFGRFPHRNAILGRESTPEELDWLASREAFRG
ncbi:MAG: DUF924 domain-containing protein [Gammaproteobacteria bacterium]|nr:DUF924 domain-containing protein [Gammaproteobacteria bacterium]MCW8839505.1 DUF924 domain-containing protein [Gammaproteobacteria bacterium]MCW8959497.1 DUF924 domain-containing protein [Gammaproteobacteria bacterium]MCW8972573.1 DUF924 domain-containing protein [Gammaproteobacteria bacterium]MCW8993184.1 DUF924 domain-containing protein [Gammaproteobacteria bacterium]